MRRSIAVLCWILVGAFAAGSAIGYFLYQANHDRVRLAETVRKAEEQVSQIKTAQEKTANEANRKVAEASAEVTRTQDLLKRYEEERKLLLKAIPLNMDPRKLKTWSESVSYPLGVSIRLPPGMNATQTEEALVVGKASNTSGTDQWLSISAYNAQAERQLTDRLTDQVPRVYVVNDRILNGVRGKMADLPGYVYLFDIIHNATSTHLIWARSGADMTESKVLETLSTLAFRT